MGPALIFDFDGVIVASEQVVYDTWREFFVSHDHDLPLEIWSRCIGGDERHFDPGVYAEERGLGDRQAVRAHLAHEVRERCLKLPSIPGARELMATARRAHIPLGIASSSPRRWVEGHLERLGLLSSFTSIRTRDDGAVKPAPFLYERVIEDLDAAPEKSWAIEDSGPGVVAAKRAGLRVVAIPNAMTASHDVSWADLVVQRFAEITLEGLGLRQGP